MKLEQKYHLKSEPQNTCPIIDTAIASVTQDFNVIRAENEAIRAWGDGWKTVADKISDELADTREKMQDDIYRLDKELKELEDEFNKLANELEEANNTIRDLGGTP